MQPFRISGVALLLSAASVFTGLSGSRAHACSPKDPAPCAQFNARLNRLADEALSTRKRLGDYVSIPAEALAGTQTLRAFGIKVFTSSVELSKVGSVSDAIEVGLQEWLRSVPREGMTWLPMTWTLGPERIGKDMEISTPIAFNNLEQSVEKIFASVRSRSDALMASMLLASSIPHSTKVTDGGDLIQSIYASAARMGTLYEDFFDIRVEIHQAPSLRTLERIRGYLAKSTDQNKNKLIRETLLIPLEKLFGGVSAAAYFASVELPTESERRAFQAGIAVQAKLAKVSTAKGFGELFDGHELPQAGRLIAEGIRAARAGIDQAVACSDDAAVNCRIERIDEISHLQALAFSVFSQAVAKAGELRVDLPLRQILLFTESMVRVLAELDSLSPQLADRFAQASQAKSITALEVRQAFAQLERETRAKITDLSGLFAPVLRKYAPFTELSRKYVDRALRTSPLLPLLTWANAAQMVIKDPGADADAFYISDAAFGGEFRVLNPGVARGTLYLLTESDLAPGAEISWDPSGVYILSKTPSSISKVAGILSAESGSLISHVQLLAQNHGIPNVFIDSTFAERLQPLVGKEVFLASLASGEVQIKLWSQTTKAEQGVYESYSNNRQRQRTRLPIPEGIHAYKSPLHLQQLRLEDRGKVAGGKACGQGELARAFGETVPHGIVLPFGVYYDHIVRAGIYQKLQDSFKAIPAAVDGDSASALARKSAVEKALDEARKSILALEIDPALTQYIEKLLARPAFRGQGVFVRSDTNAEDLPQFVGAGLNLTVPNVFGAAEVIKAVKEVWASPFTPKSFAWREALIENPWDVFPSVVIQVAMASEKAGVMVVGNTQSADGWDDEILIAANYGLGFTVVDGDWGPEETLISRKAGTTVRLRGARAPSKKVFAGPRALKEVPLSAAELQADGVMSPENLRDLTDIAKRIQAHMAAAYGQTQQKWDLEFGVVGGRVILFQIRPFVGNKVIRDVGGLALIAKGKPREAPPAALDPSRARFTLATSEAKGGRK